MRAALSTEPASASVRNSTPAETDGEFPDPLARMGRTRAETVAAHLRESIYNGDLPAGSRIRLKETARLLGVSAMPVRDALRLLEADELVTLVPRSGARVSDLSSEDIEELYAMRAGLEGLAARLAVPRLDAATVSRLEHLFEMMASAQSARNPEAFVRHDRTFHRTLYEASARPRLVKRILDLWDNSRRAMPIGYRSWYSETAALESHRIILAAAQARNPAAAERLVREHTDEAALRILQAFSSPPGRRRKRRSGEAASAPFGAVDQVP
jgi:DNA-binding GntR family transcriptional regulator